ncbi:HNH endonuclease [Pseudomonas aeruginosa]|uniref:HNH endonuclease n=1 Tax=Pseudomonas aeruginosa TaxID=287 RepID=UPI001F09CB35|nr:HNH endonuclease [Pseudomonas aeruginosa]
MAVGVIDLFESDDNAVVAVTLTDRGRHWNPAFATYEVRPVAVPAYPRRRSQKKPIPQALRAQVFERDGYACLRCGCDEVRRLRADHVVAESLGGPATLENLQTLCMSCNSWKGVKTIDFRVAGGQA